MNLWALLRHLSQRAFVGRVHVELNDYTADVFLTGSKTPLVHEVDRANGTDVIEESALHRLVLRARESPGSITVFEGADEAVAVQSGAADAKGEVALPATSSNETPQSEMPLSAYDGEPAAQPLKAGVATSTEDTTISVDASASRAEAFQPEERVDWGDVVKASGELIGAVERALTGTGADFASLFRAARLDLADDYTFLDPISERFQYSNSMVTVTDELPVNSYVTGLSEALRRVVDKVATGDRARRVRERVALDLALVARRRDEVLQRSGFREQLDWIAGTKVQ